MDVFREFREHMEKYLRNARIDKSRVHDDVVLVGGFIRFPRVHSRHLHKKVVHSGHSRIRSKLAPSTPYFVSSSVKTALT